MSDFALRTVGLGKMYRIGGEREAHGTLRDALARATKRPIERIRHPGAATHTSVGLWALKDINLEVDHGEALGIIGRNGAGKTTLLKVLSHITEPTEGRVEIRGRVASLLEVGTGFHAELTGRENIQLNGAILGMTRAEVKSRFDDIVEFSGIGRFLDTPVKRYSSGMYVRLAFAVAAHLDPEILIIDEVLAVGDADFQKKCLGKMKDVAGHGRTVVFVSHNLTAIRSLCSRVIVFEEGKLNFDGTPIAAVSHYLGTSGAHVAERDWKDTARAPGGTGVRCRAVRLRDADGTITAEIDVQQHFDIEVDYEVLGAGAKAGVTFVVFNDEGIMLFSSINNRDSEWHERDLPAGMYRSTCTIPGDLLNGGEHTVTLIMWADGYRPLAREDEVVRFNVHDTGGARGGYMGGFEGAVRPVLDWRNERLR